MNNGAGGWKVKDAKKGISSTFFPDDWTKERVQKELTLAFSQKIKGKGNVWIGEMSDGVKCKFHIENGLITSAYPIFN